MSPIALAKIGHNNAPGPLVFGSETMAALSDWMAEHPLIESEDDARTAKLLVDRAKVAINEIEAERKILVGPLNAELDEINGQYGPLGVVRKPLKGIMDTLLSRMTAFAKAEEIKRITAAKTARKVAEEAERVAREAEAKEREAHENANAGELDIDLGASTVAADQAFADFQRAGREAARADKATHVRIAGGFANAVSLKNKEILTVENVHEAIEAIGLTDTIREAILSSARAYRKQFGELPDGIAATFERHI